MKREIKFRAWHKTYDLLCDVVEIVFGDDDNYVAVENGEYIERWRFDDIELMQYTGLKDVHGVDIYEGDIVQPVRPETLQEINSPLIVETANYVSGKWIARNVASESYGVEDYYFKNELSVIGNKFQNPELLEAD